MRVRRTILMTAVLAALAGPSGAPAAPVPAGTYEVSVTSASGVFGVVQLPLPFPVAPARISVADGVPATWSLGSIVIPQITGFGPYDVTLSTGFPGEVVAQLDPATGDASTQVQFFVSFSGTYTAQGQAPIPFSCTIADEANPVVVRPTTARGASWNAQTGEIKLVDDTFPMPPTACAPPEFNDLLGDTSAGKNSLTIDAKLLALPAPAPAPSTGNSVAPTTRCIVPKVTLLTLAAAKRRIAKAHCRMGKLKHRRSHRRAGTVLRQSPRAGSRRPARTKVDLTVAKR